MEQQSQHHFTPVLPVYHEEPGGSVAGYHTEQPASPGHQLTDVHGHHPEDRATPVPA